MAGTVDLVFARTPLTDNPVGLVFGESDSSAVDHPITIAGSLPALSGLLSVATVHEATVAGTLPALVGNVRIATVVDATISGTLPGLSGAISARYISGAERPTVGQAGTHWQVADRMQSATEDRLQGARATPAGTDVSWQTAQTLDRALPIEQQEADPAIRFSTTSAHQDAAQLGKPITRVSQQDALHNRRLLRRARQQDGVRAQRSTKGRTQDGIRDKRNWTAAHWQPAAPHFVLYRAPTGPGARLNRGWESDYQDAMHPPPGTSPRPTIPGVEPCYTPPDGSHVDLLFATPWSDNTNLVFVCERHVTPPGPGADVVVPIKRVYVVLNESSLRRVDGNIALPTYSMSLSLDVDSWTWSFSASLPAQALPDLEPNLPGEPVLVEAMINGVPYLMQIEKRGRDRSFASNGLKISGRGLSAILDAPHSAIRSFTNPVARTARQLMDDILTENGVSIGWDIDWQAVDWSVPAGVFVHQGSYISALNAVAEAAGSYLQPDRVAQILRVLPRYPAAPWDWSAVTPDFEIPAAVATVEGIEWVDKANYNRVYVSGVQDGVLGRVTRAGTDGGLVAPMVTDALITTEAAARQRGIPVLADTGSQANVSLKMPVLPETGIIVPGKFIRYVDGGVTRLGITRGVSVDVRSPETWQTIALETHV